MHSKNDEADEQEAQQACHVASYESDIATLALAVLVRLTAHAGMAPCILQASVSPCLAHILSFRCSLDLLQ